MDLSRCAFTDTRPGIAWQVIGMTCELSIVDAVHGMKTDGRYRCRYMLSWEEFVTRVLGWSEESFRKADEAMEEAKKGAAITMPLLVWVARKQ